MKIFRRTIMLSTIIAIALSLLNTAICIQTQRDLKMMQRIFDENVEVQNAANKSIAKALRLEVIR